ncbi:hypothetical protein DL239_20785 [Sedimentitalea sp. CY04]|uniref:Glucokinase n=1 Tax=Parasedimentitalea denitrificans TaxID=2211118 RepID=A0ABX0WCN2_9RHOB|nr:glucokinase [Sedimentitalea sp. CY04]NIZ63404.1 hypothetical protein [Sedimentitalea sp. CY04]
MTTGPILVADIGGTNTRLGLAGANGIHKGTSHRYRNSDYTSFYSLVGAYLRQQKVEKCHKACLAVAAPVEDDAITLTNRDWHIDKSSACAVTGATEIRFLNDFEALGFAIGRLSGGQVSHVAGPKTATSQNGTRMVLGAGTGFNAAAMTLDADAQPVVHAAECGHMTLPVETPNELLLRDHLARNRGRASVERALSGQGVLEIYQWVCSHTGVAPQNFTTQEIIQQAIEQRDETCEHTAKMLVRLLARVAGDLVLAFLPVGGLYLSGGVTRACKSLISSDLFWDEFTAKGRQSNLLRSVPVYLMTDDHAALEGCLAAMMMTGSHLSSSGLRGHCQNSITSKAAGF